MDEFFEALERAVHAKKYTLETVAEVFREVGTLVIVFVPLYKIFEGSHAEWKHVLGGLVVGFAFVIGGILLERVRK